jgi:hypothetical protein
MVKRKRVKLSIVNDVEGKECTQCDVWKPLEEFSLKKNGLGKRGAECKSCKKVYREKNREATSLKSKEYYLKNKEKVLNNVKEYYSKNSDKVKEYNRLRRLSLDKEQVRLYRQTYRQNNLENEIDRSRRHYVNNTERYKENGKRHYKENKDKYLLSNHTRRAFLRYLEGELTEEERDISLKTFNNGCALTGYTEYHLDHVIPLSIGHGGTKFGNIVPLRADLNISKGDRNIFEWFKANRQRFDLSVEKFDTLIAWLAEVNGVSVEEYQDYVYWCHANPHSLEDLRNEDESGAI